MSSSGEYDEGSTWFVRSVMFERVVFEREVFDYYLHNSERLHISLAHNKSTRRFDHQHSNTNTQTPTLKHQHRYKTEFDGFTVTLRARKLNVAKDVTHTMTFSIADDSDSLTNSQVFLQRGTWCSRASRSNTILIISLKYQSSVFTVFSGLRHRPTRHARTQVHSERQRMVAWIRRL